MVNEIRILGVFQEGMHGALAGREINDSACGFRFVWDYESGDRKTHPVADGAYGRVLSPGSYQGYGGDVI